MAFIHSTNEWQIVLLVFAALVAGWQVFEARRSREESNRPFVVIDFDVEKGYLVFLEVSNLGTSLARNVRIEITPPLKSSVNVEPDKMKMLTHGIKTIAPGKSFRTFFDTGMSRGDSGLPMSYEAVVTYTDQRERRTFNETYNLDFDIYMNLSEITRYGMHDIHERLKELVRELHSWSRPVGQGLITASLQEHQAEVERRLGELQQQAEDEGEQGQEEASP